MEILIGAIAGVVALSCKIVYDARHRRGRRFGVWRRAGKRYASEIRQRGDELSFEVELEEARVLAAVTIDSESSVVTGEVSAHYVVCGSGPIYTIRPHELGDGVGKLLGSTEDIELETSRVFDEHFIVSCEDRDKTRAAWPWRIMHAAASTPACTSITSSADRVTASVQPEADAAEIAEVIELVGRLASVDLVGHHVLEAIPGARFVAPAGPWNARTAPFAILELRPDIELRFAELHGRLITTVWSATVGPERDLEIVDGAVARGVGDGLPTASIEAVGDCTLRVSDQLGAVLAWSDIEARVDRLRAGLALVAAATTFVQSPYR